MIRTTTYQLLEKLVMCITKINPAYIETGTVNTPMETGREMDAQRLVSCVSFRIRNGDNVGEVVAHRVAKRLVKQYASYEGSTCYPGYDVPRLVDVYLFVTVHDWTRGRGFGGWIRRYYNL